MIRASLRGLLQRKLRLSLAVFAIVLSVGFLSAILVLSGTLNAQFSTLFSTINQNVAVQVQADEPGPRAPRLTAEQVRELAATDGVSASSPKVSAEGVVPYRATDDTPVSTDLALGFGVDGKDDPLGLVALREGAWPVAADEVAISAHTAEQAKVKRGDQLKVYLPVLNEPRTFRVVGVVGIAGGRDSLAGETMVLFQEAFAQQTFYGQTGVYAGVSFAAADGVSQQQLRDRIRAKLPSGFTAKTADEVNDEQAKAVGSRFDFFTYILVGFAVLAGLVGIFLIYNTFNIIVAQRTRELALLRALGAGWGQVAASVLLEALVVSAVGATLGLGVGIGLGYWGESALAARIQMDPVPVVVSPLTVLLAYALGIVVTMVAAFIPAIRASSVPPVAAMRDLSRPDKSLLGLSLTGAAFALPGAGLVLLGALADLGGAGFLVLLGGAVLLLLGSLLLAPLLARPVIRALGFVLGRGEAGKLGVRNALRNPRRTAVTAVALTVGVMMVGTAATVVESFKSSLRDTLGESVGVEVLIQSQLNAAPDGTQGFDPKALDRVRAIPGVKDASAWHFDAVDVAVAGQPQFVFATDVAQAARMFSMKAVSGDLRALGAQELVLDENTAKALGLAAGEQTRVRLGPVERQYTVVAVYETSPLVSGILVGPPAVADFNGPLAFQGLVSLSEGVDAGPVVTQVEQIMKDYPGVRVGDRQSYIEESTSQLDGLLIGIQLLLVVSLVIAALGILNTLMLSVTERTRELGLVRAIGLSRGGVVATVTVESILMAVFGVALGLALGVGIGAALTQALIRIKFATAITIPWTQLVAYLVVAVLAGVVAAILPARRAARLNVLEAIAYE
ncbi:ABC transporter permease [Catellatospora tritici]|uniref:ABC transporter permease n=1 Tax=Catellatospora tritici TaxID=2851566 RepID=UPI001C2DD45B|nr:FtsX-like permease family protein [Catellatospora tritici]MBV1852923.1 ABC transporter permease [Catellatospora tritici]